MFIVLKWPRSNIKQVVNLCFNSHLESSRSQIISKPNQSHHNSKLSGVSHKVALFPSFCFSCFRFSCLLPQSWYWMIMSHIAHTSSLMEVWGLITAQNSVWFGEEGRAGGGRLDASRISESAGVRCDSLKCCVSLHSASHTVRWWAGWSPSCLRDFGAPTTDYSIWLESMNATTIQSEFVLQLRPGSVHAHMLMCSSGRSELDSNQFPILIAFVL